MYKICTANKMVKFITLLTIEILFINLVTDRPAYGLKVVLCDEDTGNVDLRHNVVSCSKTVLFD
jgi:hypothetical protein